MSITSGDASDDSSVLSTLMGVCFGVGVCLSVGRSFEGVVKSIKNMDDARFTFVEVDGVPKSIRSRLQLSSFSSESTPPFGVLYTLLGVEMVTEVEVEAAWAGLRTHVKDFSTLTPASRGEKEVMTTSERAHNLSSFWWLPGGVAVFSLFCVASRRSTLGVSHVVVSALGGGEIFRASSSKWDSL